MYTLMVGPFDIMTNDTEDERKREHGWLDGWHSRNSHLAPCADAKDLCGLKGIDQQQQWPAPVNF